LPTTRSPRPRANSVSVAAGVSETMCCGSAGIVTLVPSSSVSVSGNAATAEGLSLGAGVRVAVATGVAGSGVGLAAVPPQAAITMARTRRSVVGKAMPRWGGGAACVHGISGWAGRGWEK
jgi:hypothetical protein